MNPSERSAENLKVYKRMTPREIRRVALAVFTCPEWCPLLTAVQLPRGRLVYLPRYKIEKSRNESESIPAARAKHTTDGVNHWPERVVVADDYADLPVTTGLPLNCDHVRGWISFPQLLADLDAAQPGRPTRRVYTSRHR